MEALEIIAIAAVAVFVLKYFGVGLVKAVPIKKTTAGLFALIIAGAGIVVYDWGGIYSSFTAGVPGAPEPSVTPGVLFEAEGSEAVENFTYDAPSKTFTLGYYENQASTYMTAAKETGHTAIRWTSVTLTITVYRTDLLSVENATAKIWAEVGTFYGKNENSGILYAPVDKDDGTQRYEVAFTPAGGSARDEYNFFTVGQGGSKAISIVTDLYDTGLTQLDNGQSKDVRIYITGVDGYFTLRFTKLGEIS